MTLSIYQYPTCSTCRKAIAFLKDNDIAFRAVHIVEAPPSASVLKKAIKDSGLPIKAFFNTSGESYKSGGFKDRLPNMSEADAIAALCADGKLIKRPLVIDGSTVLVGFKEEAWQALRK